MACFHPNKVLVDKTGYVTFLGSNRVHIDTGNHKYHLLPGRYDIGNDVYGKPLGFTIKSVPCGKCDGCRIDQSREWANRCVLESMCYPKDQNWFLTLTYDDADPDFRRDCTVNDVGFFNLYPRHVTLFLKRLRQAVPDHVRYFYCGEYGDHTLRPHYHMLLFGVRIPDLQLYSTNFQGDALYNSKMLFDLWGHGYVVVGELNYQTCAYTARYVVKKRKQGDCNYEDAGVTSEFTRMSRDPGIGVPYLEEHIEEVLDDGKLYLPGPNMAALAVGLPRLFDDYLEKNYPNEYANIVAKRENMFDVSNHAFLRSLPSFDEREYFNALEYKSKKQMQALKRIL